MEIYKKLPNDLKKIIDEYLHHLRLREIMLSLNYMSNCHLCDEYYVRQSDIFTYDYINELVEKQWRFCIPYICCYNFYN